MRPITRRAGTTPTEKYLAKLADSTFLNLWSYPNPYYDKLTAKNGTGKELCDLLVVCGDEIIIFSDKYVSWPSGNLPIAWPRWYRRAIGKSTNQINGAARWLREHSDRVFLDEDCREPLPIPLPNTEARRVHGVVIAHGAGEMCARLFGLDGGGLPIIPGNKGALNLNVTTDGFRPFGVGDVNPGGMFIHVFDDRALNLVMTELDTVTDFTKYLAKRALMIRSGRLAFASSEQEVLNHYLRHLNDEDEHDFVKPDASDWRDNESLVLIEGGFKNLQTRPKYLNKKAADKVSYAWDALINEFTKNIIAGTSISLFDSPVEARFAEQGLRIMALEPRVNRRMLGGALIDALEKSREISEDRFCRVIMPGLYRPERGIAYVFLILSYPKIKLSGGYDQYRKVRANMLQAYCLNVLLDNRTLKRAIGIGFDGYTSESELGRSEDMLAAEQLEWTPELEKEARELRDKFDILRKDRIKYQRVEADEYPEGHAAKKEAPISRQQRRALERQLLKSKRRRGGG